MSRWYVFTVKGRFIGRVFTTEAEIWATIRWCEITGNHVNIYAMEAANYAQRCHEFKTGRRWTL